MLLGAAGLPAVKLHASSSSSSASDRRSWLCGFTYSFTGCKQGGAACSAWRKYMCAGNIWAAFARKLLLYNVLYEA